MDRYGNPGRWSLWEVYAIGLDIDCPERFNAMVGLAKHSAGI